MSSLVRSLSVFLLTVVAVTTTLAESPPISFDVSQMVACREVGGERTASAPAGQRIIEAHVRVSTFINARHRSEISQLEVQLISLRRAAWVVDYLPKTTLTTDIVGPLKYERGNEASRHLGINVSGSYEKLAKATGLADASSKKRETVKYEQLPELNNIASSGIVARGTGAYFKFRSSPRTSLEGEKVLTLRLRVPETWKSGLLDVTCRAASQPGGFFSSEAPKQRGAARFLVAVYAEGDRSAYEQAKKFSDAEHRVYQLANRHRVEIRKRSLPTLAHRLGAALDVVNPRIPHDWLSRSLEHPDDDSTRRLLARLPKEVQAAIADYHQVKKRLVDIN